MLENTDLHSRLFFSLPIGLTVILLITCNVATANSTFLVNAGWKHNMRNFLFQPLNHHLHLSPHGQHIGSDVGAYKNLNSAKAQRSSRHSSPVWFKEGFSHTEHRSQSRSNPDPVSPETGTAYNSYPSIERKSSTREAWSPRDVWTSNKPLYRQPVGQSSGFLSTPRSPRSSLQKTRDVSATTRGQSRFFRVDSQSNSQSTTARNNMDISDDQRNLSIEKSPSTITRSSSTTVNTSLGISARTKSKALKPIIGHSYLFKDLQNSLDSARSLTGGGQLPIKELRGDNMAPAKTRNSEDQVYGRIDSGFEGLHRKDQRKATIVSAVHLKTSVPETAGQSGSSWSPSAQILSDPGLGEVKPEELSSPKPQFTSTEKNVTRNEKRMTRKPVISSSSSRSQFGFRLEGFPRLYGIKGFTNPLRSSMLSSKGRSNSSQNSSSSISPKYSFGQVRSSPTLFPAKFKLTPSTATIPTSSLFSAGSKKVQLLGPESNTTVNHNLHQRWVKSRIFGTRPLEGAKNLQTEPDRSPVLNQGFGVRTSETWQPRSSQIYRRYNKTGETLPGSGKISTERKNELNSKNFNPLRVSDGHSQSLVKSQIIPSNFEKNPNIHSSRGFTPAHSRIHGTGRKFTEENPTYTISPSPPGSAEGFRETEPIPVRSALFNRASSNLTGGKHRESNNMDKSTLQISESANADMVPLPKQPVRISYADVVGSATFVGVRSRTQTPVKPHDNVFSPESVTPKSRQYSRAIKSHDGGNSKENTSRVTIEKSVVEDEVLEVTQQSFEFGRRMKTLADFMDNEGSGSGAFNLPDVSSAERRKSQGLSGDLLELDYLQRSTGNVSFKSVRQDNVKA